jgi:hypothetical protein
MSVKFLGKPQGKKSYSFTRPVIYKVGGTQQAPAQELPVSTSNTADIPF